MATVKGGWVHFLVGGVTVLMTFARKGARDRTSLVGVVRVRRGCVHGQGKGGLARRERAHSIVLMEALGSMKGRILGHAMTCSIAWD
ncbi:hypothetical protein CRG98_044207 [Punica granatum]|uniref:Uncharacterized protein n=1 Tax=Punica granatum TaxID=22663 RepID=A0A2I0HUM6_PUNGR|nr:hypothetical protein CRG98_044207 [Punica granatum]